MRLAPLPENFAAFADMLREFCTFSGQTIHAPKKLAEMMAAKARLLQTILENALTSDESRMAHAEGGDGGHLRV